MVLVGLDRSLRVPAPDREMPDPCQSLTSGLLSFWLVQQLRQIRVGIHDADQIARGHDQ
jgi:hypothetical protein